jgi:tripartite-type tricarboxylate transporter receptor subunit TctC
MFLCALNRRRAAIFAAAALCFVLSAGNDVRAQTTYPERPIHLLVPYPAGGPNDVIARLIANQLDQKFKQQVVVENRAGGSGNIAVISAARAEPDGYTIVLPAMAYAVNPSLFTKVGYTFDQFVPVSIVTQGPLVLVVHPSLGVKSVKELIALARKEPGKINYGSGGNGSSLHLAGEMFKQEAKVDIQHIPYKGTNDLISDLLSGRVPIAFMSPLIAKEHVAQGRLIALGITSKKRLPSWPDVPTVAEAGVPGYAVEAWYAIIAPKATPKPVVDKLSAAIAEAVKSPEVSGKLAALGNEPVGSTPEEAQRYIAAEAKRWNEVLTAAGIKLD